MSKSEKGFDMELLFRALADRTRLRLLNLMMDTEICVCFFVEVLGTNQPKISRHLAYLRRAGVVAARREGKWMHYSITTPDDEHAARVFSEVLTWLGEEREMQRDRARMETICCAPRMPVRLPLARRGRTHHGRPTGLRLSGMFERRAAPSARRRFRTRGAHTGGTASAARARARRLAGLLPLRGGVARLGRLLRHREGRRRES